MKKEYKVVFCGDFSHNNGPANVNKYLLRYFKCKKIDTKGNNKLKIFISFISSFFKCKVFIFSSNYRINYFFFRIAKFFNKKTIYLMHGCSQLDSKINKIKNAERMIKIEKKLIGKVDLILTVSKKYMNLINELFPKYKQKIYYLTNGIFIDKYNSKINVDRKENIISVCGGNRLIKCNKNVSLAVNNLNKDNVKYYLNVYGLIYDENENIIENDYIKVIGCVPQNELFEKLRESKLFVLNSMYESFGLSIVDALMCGCNILISKNAGITDILKLEETDIINDFNDLNEIEGKIKYNLEHDNNQRILESIDFEHYSWKNVSNRLTKIVEYFQSGEDYTKIK